MKVCRIRKMNPQDTPEYLAMCREFYDSPAVLHPVDENHFTRTAELVALSSPYVDVFLFEKEETNPSEKSPLMGYATISKTYSQEAGGTVCLIEEVYVRSPFRGMGIFKEFLSMLRGDSSFKRFRLEVARENQKAIELYRSMAFEELPYMQMIIDV